MPDAAHSPIAAPHPDPLVHRVTVARTPRRGSAAQVFDALALRLATERLTLRDVLVILGDRSMGSTLLLLTLPQLVPIPLLLSNLLALPVVLIAAQMACGRTRPWLPRRLLDRPVHGRRLARGCGRLAAMLRRIERFLGARLWPPFNAGAAWWAQTGRRLFGAGVLLIALVLLAPLPLTTWLPAWALVTIAVGLLKHNGLVVGAGFALGAAAVAVFAATVLGLVQIGAEANGFPLAFPG